MSAVSDAHRRDHQQGRGVRPHGRRRRAARATSSAAARATLDRRRRRADRAAQQSGPAGGLQRTGAGRDRAGRAEPAAESDLLDLAHRRQRRQRDRAPGGRRHPGAGDPAVPHRHRARAFPSGAVARGAGDAAARRRGPARLLPHGRRQRDWPSCCPTPNRRRNRPHSSHSNSARPARSTSSIRPASRCFTPRPPRNSPRRRQEAASSRERLIRLMGLWGDDLRFRTAQPSAGPAAPSAAASRRSRSMRSTTVIDLQIARIELTRWRNRLNSRRRRASSRCSMSPASTARRPIRESAPFRERGFDVQFQIPIFDGGEVRVRQAAETYNLAFNRLTEKAVNVRSEARDAYPRLSLDLRHRHPLSARGSAAAQDHLGRDAAALLQHAGRRVRAADGSPPAHRLAARRDRRQARLLAGAVRPADRRQWRRPAVSDNPTTTASRLAERPSGADIERRHHVFSQRISRHRHGAGQRAPPSAAASRPRTFPKRRRWTRRRCSRRCIRPSGPDYRPVVTLNGWTLPWRMNGDWKEFHLVAEPVVREFAPGMKANLWGYNGQSPGPTIEAVEGDKVRIFVTNKLAGTHHGALARHDRAERHGRRRRPDPAAHQARQDLRLRVRAEDRAAPSCTTRTPTRWCRWRWA